MNFFLKQRLWFFIALFFMIVTITLLFGMFRHKHKQHERGHERHRPFRQGFKRGPNFSLTEYLAKELTFTPEQKTKLEALNGRMEARKDSLWQQNEISKELFSEQLFSITPNKLRQDSLITSMNKFTEVFNRTRMEQADKIKALCTEEQKKKLPEALSNINGIYFRKGDHHGGEGNRDSTQINSDHMHKKHESESNREHRDKGYHRHGRHRHHNGYGNDERPDYTKDKKS